MDDEESMTLRQNILRMFDITNNPNNNILCSIVEDSLNNSKKKIKNEFESMGIEKKVSNKGDTRKQTCFFGIKLIAIIPEKMPEQESVLASDESNIEPSADHAKVKIDTEEKESENDDDEELDEKYFNGKKYYVSNKNGIVYDVDEDDSPGIEVGSIKNGIIKIW